MAKYTIELGTLFKDPTFNLFDFDYEFYADDEELRKNFERTFIETYYFHEIGQETVHRFKMMLKHRLNLEMPYYRKIYDIELQSKGLDFLSNKNYTETHTREIITELISTGKDTKEFTQTSSINTSNTKEGNSTLNNNNTVEVEGSTNKSISGTNTDTLDTNTNSNNSVNSNSTDSINSNTSSSLRESYVRDGIANVVGNDNDLTGANSTNSIETHSSSKTDKVTNNTTESSNTTNTHNINTTESDRVDSSTQTTENSTSTTNITDTLQGNNTLENSDITNKSNTQLGKNIETFTNTGKGNIGVISQAKILKEFRDIQIELNRDIIDSLYNLFMLIY